MLRKLCEKYGTSQSNAATVLTGPFFPGEGNRGCCPLIHRVCILQGMCCRDVLPSPSSRPQVNLVITSPNLHFFQGGGKLNGNDVRYTKCTVSVRLSKCLQLEIIQKNLKEKEVQISVKSMGLLAPKFCGIL